MSPVTVALLSLVLLAAPAAAGAQARTVHQIALVDPATPAADLTEEKESRYLFSELRRLGYVEGKNLVVERHSAEGRTERFPDLAKEVVKLKPDLIVASTGRMIGAFKAATGTIPIVGITADPVAEGLVANLARPGGNITGIGVTAGYELLGKRLQLLQEAVPGASRVAFLVPRAPWESRYGPAMRDAAQRAGVTLVGAPLSDPIGEPEYRRVFEAMSHERPQAVVVSDQPENTTHRRVIVDLAAQWRLPAMYAYREFVDLGGLMAYATDLADVWRRVAGYIDRILKGADPGQLPYQQATKFSLLINLKTAKALGLTIPQSVLARADEVIE